MRCHCGIGWCAGPPIQKLLVRLLSGLLDFQLINFQGYTENSLSVFNVSDFPNRSIPLQPNSFLGENVTECRCIVCTV